MNVTDVLVHLDIAEKTLSVLTVWVHINVRVRRDSQAIQEKNVLILMNVHKCLVQTESVAFQPSVPILSVVLVVGVLLEVTANRSPDVLSRPSVTRRLVVLEMPFVRTIAVYVRLLSLARDVNVSPFHYQLNGLQLL